MDTDLERMSREQLIKEAKRLRQGNWPQFIQGCVRYRQSFDEQAPNAPTTKKPYEE